MEPHKCFQGIKFQEWKYLHVECGGDINVKQMLALPLMGVASQDGQTIRLVDTLKIYLLFCRNLLMLSLHQLIIL